MSTIFLYEDGHENVADEEGGPQPMDYIVDENGFVVETLAIHSEYMQTVSSSESSLTSPMLIEKPKDEDTRMKDANTKRDYVRYAVQDKVRFFELKIEKYMNALSAAKKLGIHTRTAYRWANYESKHNVYIGCRFDNSQSKKKPRPAKKRKAEGYISSGTVTGHYISFLKMTLDEMDKHPHMKGHYVVMDNAPIHTHKNIKKYIEYRGYKCVHLPTYSPELNPIEQFWAVAKSKIKHHRFLQENTLSKRINKACKDVEKSHFRGFVSHSYKCWDECRNREPM
ncbi:hypothetical protein CU098_009345 [Rhizopus stolonifer]|uniref:Tc1-like transposase DDE domain-containing protein n=1 Tax=Rhizopus stolonifer TaxID=4846 RepID=A0A367JXF6_RHIST|nr:hypothetical protein CU098_009345 [Rhizopus stolonifer]